MPTVIAPAIAAGLNVSLATATTIATVGLYVATTAASYFIQQAMAPKPETGTKLTASLGGAVNQSFIFGEKETAGSFIYRGTWGVGGKVPNGFLVNVYCLQDMRSEQVLPRVWTAKKASMDQGSSWSRDGKNLGHPVAAFDRDGSHFLGIRVLDGTQTSADSYLRDVFGGSANRPWTTDMVGRGRTLAIVTQRYSKKEPEGEVAPVFVVKGIRLYDWRKDSTNGGSGSHRYGTYSTYEYSANPVVVMYNIMRGIYHGSDWMYGGQGWPATRFDNDAWTAAANVCDENVSLAGGGTEKRYRCGGEVSLAEEPWTVIERLLKACNGRIVESGGRFKVYCGGAGASVFSFTDDSILVSEELTARLFPAREDIANTITGTYVEPENGGRQKAFKPRVDSDALAEDGGERKIGMDFEYVRSNTQAQRLARHALKDNRRFRTFTVALWTEARKLEPCDIVTWTSTRFGFENKKFIVGDVKIQSDGPVFVNLREVNPNDADWTTLDEDAYQTGVYGDEDIPTQTLSATASAVSITDDDNTTARAPAIRIQASVDEDFVDCHALRWQVRKRNGDQKIIARGISEGFFEPGNPEYGDIVFTSAAFKPGKQVQVRWKIVPESDRSTDWSNDWSGNTPYLTLSSSARLKIENVDTSDPGEIDAVDTGNVKPKAIQGRLEWESPTKTQAFTNRDNPTSANQNLNGASPITNPNPSPVLLTISGRLKAAVSLHTGQKGSVTRFTTKVTVYSAPVNGSGTVLTGQKVAVYSTSATAKRERTAADKIKTTAGNKTFKGFVIDAYDGADGSALRRKYWAEVDYTIEPDKLSTDASGSGSVEKFAVKGSWSKR